MKHNVKGHWSTHFRELLDSHFAVRKVKCSVGTGTEHDGFF